jgi:cation diffusion facilitator CzcD-associated flavoprotein CzcO
VDLITKDPAWFRRLSVAQREEVNYSLWAEGRLKIEPWRIRDETIKLWLRSQVAGCIEQPDGALTVKLESGETIVVDQVIAATGYEVDIARVPFLAAGNLLSLD